MKLFPIPIFYLFTKITGLFIIYGRNLNKKNSCVRRRFLCIFGVWIYNIKITLFICCFLTGIQIIIGCGSRQHILIFCCNSMIMRRLISSFSIFSYAYLHILIVKKPYFCLAPVHNSLWPRDSFFGIYECRHNYIIDIFDTCLSYCFHNIFRIILLRPHNSH